MYTGPPRRGHVRIRYKLCDGFRHIVRLAECAYHPPAFQAGYPASLPTGRGALRPPVPSGHSATLRQFGRASEPRPLTGMTIPIKKYILAVRAAAWPVHEPDRLERGRVKYLYPQESRYFPGYRAHIHPAVHATSNGRMMRSLGAAPSCFLVEYTA